MFYNIHYLKEETEIQVIRIQISKEGKLKLINKIFKFQYCRFDSTCLLELVNYFKEK